MSNGGLFRSGNSARPRSFATSRMSSPLQIGVKQGIHVIKRGMAGIEYAKPSWNGTESVFRILPGLSPEESGAFDACRVSEELGRYGAWQCCFEAVRQFGEPGITMLLSDGDQGYDVYNQNPCWILYRAIKDACESKQARPEWYALLMDRPGRGKILKKPAEMCLVQTLVFRHNDKNTFGPGQPPLGFAPGDPTVVLELGSSAACAFFDELETRRQDWDGDPNDPDAYVWDDITSIDRGAFVHFYQLGFDPREENTNTGSGQSFDPYAQTRGHGGGGHGGGGQGGGGGGGNKRGRMSDNGFGCFLTSTLDGGERDARSSLAGHEKKVMAKVKPWKDILEFYDDQTQAHILNRSFPASAILYAFQDYPEWILQETRQKAAESVSRRTGGAVPGQRRAIQEEGAQALDVPFDASGYDPYGTPDGVEEAVNPPRPRPQVQQPPVPAARVQPAAVSAPRQVPQQQRGFVAAPDDSSVAEDLSVPDASLPDDSEELSQYLEKGGVKQATPQIALPGDASGQTTVPAQVAMPKTASEVMTALEEARKRASARSRIGQQQAPPTSASKR